MANLLFCAPGTQVIELRPPGVDGYWIEALARHAGLTWKAYAAHEPVDATEAPLDAALRPASAFGWRLDLPAFLHFLDGEG